MYRFSLRKRTFLSLLGIAIAGIGVAITARASLGTSPISSLPYVLTFLIPLTFGTWTFLLNAVFVAIQAALPGPKSYKNIALQLPTTALFGVFIDVGVFLCDLCVVETYWLRVAQLLLGCAVLALGIALETSADLFYLPGDGIVKIIGGALKSSFGATKIQFDCALAASAVALSWFCLHKIEGIREGTLVAAFLVGFLVKQISRRARFLKKWQLVPRTRRQAQPQ